jgi:hypothetical protein
LGSMLVAVRSETMAFSGVTSSAWGQNPWLVLQYLGQHDNDLQCLDAIHNANGKSQWTPERDAIRHTRANGKSQWTPERDAIRHTRANGKSQWTPERDVGNPRV